MSGRGNVDGKAACTFAADKRSCRFRSPAQPQGSCVAAHQRQSFPHRPPAEPQRRRHGYHCRARKGEARARAQSCRTLSPGQPNRGLACVRFACNAPLLHSICARKHSINTCAGRILAHSAKDASRAAAAATKHEVCYVFVTLCKRDRMHPHRGRILLMMAPTQNVQRGSAVHHARRASKRNKKQRHQPPAKEPLAIWHRRSGFGAYELDAHVLGAKTFCFQ